MVVRDYLCLDFSKNNEDYLYAGSSSGDLLAIQTKSKTLSSIVQVASQGLFLNKALIKFNQFQMIKLLLVVAMEVLLIIKLNITNLFYKKKYKFKE